MVKALLIRGARIEVSPIGSPLTARYMWRFVQRDDMDHDCYHAGETASTTKSGDGRPGMKVTEFSAAAQMTEPVSN